MTLRKINAENVYRFSISPQDASLTEARVENLLAQATTEAEEAARRDGYKVDAKSDLEGRFLGIGEVTALVVVAAKSATVAKMLAAAETGGKILAKAALEGTGAAGGKLFFDKYLAPRLRKVNLLPTKFRPARKEPSSPKPKKKERGGKRH